MVPSAERRSTNEDGVPPPLSDCRPQAEQGAAADVLSCACCCCCCRVRCSSRHVQCHRSSQTQPAAPTAAARAQGRARKGEGGRGGMKVQA